MNQSKKASKSNCHHQSQLSSWDGIHLQLSCDGHVWPRSVQLFMESPVTLTAGHFTYNSSPGKTSLHLSIASSSSRGLAHMLPDKVDRENFLRQVVRSTVIREGRGNCRPEMVPTLIWLRGPLVHGELGGEDVCSKETFLVPQAYFNCCPHVHLRPLIQAH